MVPQIELCQGEKGGVTKKIFFFMMGKMVRSSWYQVMVSGHHDIRSYLNYNNHNIIYYNKEE